MEKKGNKIINNINSNNQQNSNLDKNNLNSNSNILSEEKKINNITETLNENKNYWIDQLINKEKISHSLVSDLEKKYIELKLTKENYSLELNQKSSELEKYKELERKNNDNNLCNLVEETNKINSDLERKRELINKLKEEVRLIILYIN